MSFSASTPSSTVLTNMKTTLQTTINAYNTLSYSTIRSTRTEDFVYQFLPSSLSIPPRTNDQYKEWFVDTLGRICTSFKIEPKSIIYDAEARKASMHAVTHVESVVGPASLEVVGMLTFDESGENVTRIDEFFDSAAYKDFFESLGKWEEERKGGESSL